VKKEGEDRKAAERLARKHQERQRAREKSKAVGNAKETIERERD
jgi:hypothetical protein